MPEVLPPSSKFQARRVRYHMAAYNSSGFFGLISMSTERVLSSTYNVCFHVLPPSIVLYTPRSLLGEYKCPSTDTQAISAFVGCSTILPMCWLSGRPRNSQVLPLSLLLYTPMPA